MSIKTFYPKSVKNSKSKYVHPNRLIKSRMEQECKYDKTIAELVENPNHHTLDIISIYKPKFRPIKGIRDHKKLFLIHDLNIFRKTLYNFQQHNLKIKKQYKPFKLFEDNFIEKYKVFKNKVENKYFNDKKFLVELKNELEKNNIKVPSINLNKSLFDNNLLLVKQKNIKRFLESNIGNEKGENKAYNYINKVNYILSHKKDNNQDGFDYDFNNNQKRFSSSVSYSFGNEFLLKDRNNISRFESTNNKKNISNIDKTLQSLKDIDAFINMDNQEYFEFLKRRKLEKAQTLIQPEIILNQEMNKSFYGFPKTSKNKIFQLKNEEKENFNKKKYNKSYSLVNKKQKLFKPNILKKAILKKNSSLKNYNKDISSLNISDYSSIDKTNLIKIKKLFLNKKNSIKRTQSINTIDSKMSTLYPNTSYDKFFPNGKPNTNQFKRIKKVKILSQSNSLPNIDQNIQINEIENIYDALRNGENTLNHNEIITIIKNYLRSKNENVEDITSDFSVLDIIDNYYKMRQKFNKEDFLNKNIRMKKASMMDLESIDKLKGYSTTTNLQIENLKKKMELMMNKIAFPIKDN